MANAPPRATPVSLRRTAAKADEVAITYAGHSTYYIDTPGGVRIATDSTAPTGPAGCPTSSP
jgi:L-ascorbate metabolism protein UlaG (beta-lactamase superfamily)